MTSAVAVQTEINRWWHEAGAVAMVLPQSCRGAWLETISQVIRHHRLFQNTRHPWERRLYLSLCRVSLQRMRTEGFSLLAAGYLSLTQFCHLIRLEKDLADLLAD
jgi:hypothetical protein